jgi:RNA polymerase sigma-70 factor, ECF subfamily
MNPNADDDLVNLIARCAIDDRAALKALFERLHAYLYATALRLVRRDDLAQEVLQETFIQIWQNADRYRIERAKPLTWITSILRYRALDKLHAEQRQPAGPKDEHQEDEMLQVANDQCPLRDSQQSQLRDQLARCMESLGESIRNAIELAYWQGLSREEIAGVMQTNTNTVKSWLHRGAQRLKQCLS